MTALPTSSTTYESLSRNPMRMFLTEPSQDRGGHWRDEASCTTTDPEAFFPHKGTHPKEAKKICADCPVRTLCLSEALCNNESDGVWGGLTEAERKRLKRAGVDGSDLAVLEKIQVQLSPRARTLTIPRPQIVVEGVAERDAMILELTASKVSHNEIAQRLGISTRTIGRVRTRHLKQLQALSTAS